MEDAEWFPFSKYTFLMFNILWLGKFVERNTWNHLITSSQEKFIYIYHNMKMFTCYCLISKYTLHLLTWYLSVYVYVFLSYTSLKPNVYTLMCRFVLTSLRDWIFSFRAWRSKKGLWAQSRKFQKEAENSRKVWLMHWSPRVSLLPSPLATPSVLRLSEL